MVHTGVSGSQVGCSVNAAVCCGGSGTDSVLRALGVDALSCDPCEAGYTAETAVYLAWKKKANMMIQRKAVNT